MQFDLARQFGIRVHEVADLDEDVIYIGDRGVAFVRADLSPQLRQETADWLLCEAMSERMIAGR